MDDPAIRIRNKELQSDMDIEKVKKVVPRVKKRRTYKFSNADKWVISLVVGIIIFFFLAIPPLIRGELDDYRDTFLYAFPIMFLIITIPATLAIRIFLWLIDKMRQIFIHFKLMDKMYQIGSSFNRWTRLHVKKTITKKDEEQCNKIEKDINKEVKLTGGQKWLISLITAAIFSILLVMMIPVTGELEPSEFVSLFTLPFLIFTCLFTVIIRVLIGLIGLAIRKFKGIEIAAEKIRSSRKLRITTMIATSVTNVILTHFIYGIRYIPLFFIWQPLIFSFLVSWQIGKTKNEKIIKGILIFALTFIIWAIILISMLLYWEFRFVRPGRSCVYYGDCP